MAKFLSKINSPDYIADSLARFDADKNIIPSGIIIKSTWPEYSLGWLNGTVQQKILIADNSTPNDAVFTFQQSTDSGSSFTNLLTIKDNGEVLANKFTGTLNGNANSSTQIKVTDTSPSAETWYRMVFTSASGSGNTDLRINNNDISVAILEGTTSTIGYNMLSLGNSIASGNAGNKQAKLRLHSSNTSFHEITVQSTTQAINHILPAVSGTLLNTGNYMKYALPLTGGTITGNLIVNGTIEGKTTITADTDLITKSGIVNLNDNALIQYNETDECIEFVFP